jgi:hypothetical protein
VHISADMEASMGALWLAVAAWLSFLHFAEPSFVEREQVARAEQQTRASDDVEALALPAAGESAVSLVDSSEPDA